MNTIYIYVYIIFAQRLGFGGKHRTETMLFFVTGFLNISNIVGFLRVGCSRGGGNWGTLRIPWEDWGTLGNIRED